MKDYLLVPFPRLQQLIGVDLFREEVPRNFEGGRKAPDPNLNILNS